MSPIRTRALLIAGAGAALALPAAPSTAYAESVAVPGFYSVATEAAGIQLVSVQNPPLGPVTNQFIRDTVGYAASTLDSAGGSSAAAATFYPGELAAQAGSLICTQFIPPDQPVQCPAAPPPYPLLADAQYPTNQEDTAALSGQEVGGDAAPLSVLTGIATANAHERDNASRTTVTSGTLLAGTPLAVTVGAVSSATSTKVDAKGVHVHVETTVHDITVAGQLRIQVLHAVDDVLVPEGGTPVDKPQVTVSGVSLAGHAATLDEHGLRVEGQAGPSLVRDFEQQGLSVRFVGADRKDAAGTARSAAYGVQIRFDRAVTGVPYQCVPLPAPPVPLPAPLPQQVPCPPDANRQYTVTLNLGSVGAAVIAQEGEDLSFPDFTGVVPPPDSFDVDTPSFSPPGVPELAGLPGTSGTTTGRTAAGPEVAGHAQRGVSLLSADLSTLYLALAGGTAALFVGWRAFTILVTTRRQA